jgi:glycosyltransferase involved in cell wall biosynthesis
LIENLEKKVLLGASHATCTSEAMAEAIKEAYGRKPEVIYNVFPFAEAPQPASDPGTDGPKVIWISQVLGPNRGLEILIEALSLCEPSFMVTLVGNPHGNYNKKLQKRIPLRWKNKVSFTKQIKNAEVLNLISTHHIGLALEQNDTINHSLTISNKIFQYLLCGLAVAATSTQGQKEASKTANEAICLFKPDDPQTLAKILLHWSLGQEKIKKSRSAARQAAKSKFSWEFEAEKLKKIVERGIK